MVGTDTTETESRQPAYHPKLPGYAPEDGILSSSLANNFCANVQETKKMEEELSKSQMGKIPKEELITWKETDQTVVFPWASPIIIVPFMRRLFGEMSIEEALEKLRDRQNEDERAIQCSPQQNLKSELFSGAQARAIMKQFQAIVM
ncbi:hypothetical protein GPALN_010322 [Globodera pallida]|nr:hypothetical protein GPALN_010322 [Globodera pallida]